MENTVLITGSSGEIAKYLIPMLKNNFSLKFLTREPKNKNEFKWDIINEYLDEAALDRVQHIIHLAGANIGTKRWSKKRKEEIISSRVNSAKLLLNCLKNRNQKIKTFISASAIGYYGYSPSLNRTFTEGDSAGKGFLSEVCIEWEKIADDFIKFQVAERVAKVRTGIVLSSSKKGMLEILTKVINLYMGAALGSGNQYVPWIHIYDLCSVYKYILENTFLSGPFNAVSAENITNKQITEEIAKIIQKPLILPNIPEFIIKLLLGKRSELILKGNKISNEKLRQKGFSFHFTQSKIAIRKILNK